MDMLKNIRLVIFCSAFAFISCGGLVACGTKGPLYIPEQRYPQKEPAQKTLPQEEDIKANPEANTNTPAQPTP